MNATQYQIDPGGLNARPREAVPAELLPARARFCGLIVQRIMIFEALRIDVNAGKDAPTALSGIIDLAHKIAGVAETLGFPLLGQMAAQLERQLRDGLARQVPLGSVWQAVEPQLLALMDALEMLLDD